MENLKNCKRCGKLFLRVSRDICPDCFKQEEEDFEKVKKYLDDHPKAKIIEVSTETGVSQKQIKKFIEEGRLMASKYEAISVECRSCGAEITAGKYCEKCQEKLSKGFEAAKGDEQKKEKDTSQKEAGRIHIQDRLDRRKR